MSRAGSADGRAGMNRISAASLRARKAALVERLPEKGSLAWILMMMGLGAIPLILLPFTFWYMVWHGTALKPEDVQAAFTEPLKPGQAGAMLLRLGEKMSRGDDTAARWYPRIVELSKHESPQLRRTVAWAMGKDLRRQEFRNILHTMLRDPEARVRRAAAISLAYGGDMAARQVLLESIGPQVVKSTVAGSVNPRIQAADTTTPETAIAMIGDAFVEAGITGTVKRVLVKDGEMVSRGQPLIEVIAPVEELVDSLRALANVGNAADSDAVKHCAEEAIGEHKVLIQSEAERTLRRIAARPASGTGVANLHR